MPLAEHRTGTYDDTQLYLEIQHFYGRQMRHLDSGAVEEWALTFTEDGVFAANAHPEPQRGRAEIEAGARRAAAQLAAEGIQRRHWLGMLQVDPQDDDTVLARTYALITSTAQGGQAEIRLSCTCDDVLVREDGRLKVRHRQVYRDDLPTGKGE
ncbi:MULTISPECIES: nuclear transport factor 2 family protein [unclassified Streptomyces]|uniref:nuclear transport factor 2 family protein n=1 Tax=unclassified Streptomyces TaxID=2593676 RepID=UPI0011CEB797|nr:MULTISPECIES: nuclear transport factor 2 family protein [Streptomyces]TXJ74892.1 nuclear transport factor 2 family protein [Streptomyces lavendulae]